VSAGELLKAIARRLFHLPVCRFVDDFFAAESSEVADHGMRIFSRSALRFACICNNCESSLG
jgi:hypothetical protein